MVLVDDYFYFLSSSFQFSLSYMSSYLLHILNLLISSVFFLEYFLFPFLLFKSTYFLISVRSSTFSTKPSLEYLVMLSMSLVFFQIWVIKWHFFLLQTLQNYTFTWVFSPSECSLIELNIPNSFVTCWLLEYMAYGFQYFQWWQIIVLFCYIWFLETDDG